MFRQLLVIAFASSVAQSAVFFGNRDGTPILAARECAEVVAEARQIARLRSRIDGGAAPEISARDCVRISEGDETGYGIALRPVLPRWVASVLDRVPRIEGPNCIAAVIAGRGIMPFGAGVYEREAAALLASPLCRVLPSEQTARAGDIVAVRNRREGLPSHFYMMLSDSIAFEKPTRDRDAFVLIHRDEAKHYYGGDPARRDVLRCRTLAAAIEGDPMRKHYETIRTISQAMDRYAWGDFASRSATVAAIARAREALRAAAGLPEWYRRLLDARYDSMTEQFSETIHPEK